MIHILVIVSCICYIREFWSCQTVSGTGDIGEISKERS